MIGGTLGTLSMLSHGLDIIDNDPRTHFRKILFDVESNYYDSESNFKESDDIKLRRISVSNTEDFEQIIFKMDDKRLTPDDNRKIQCITFVGERHSFRAPLSKMDTYNIKIWSLCTLLKIKYEKTTSFYLEFTDKLTHKQIFKMMDDLIKKAREDNGELIKDMNKNKTIDYNQEVTSKDGKHSFRITKKPYGEAVVRLVNVFGTQGIDNTVYKLLEYSFELCDCDQVKGISFIDNRLSILSKYDIRNYFLLIYHNDITSLNKHGWEKLVNFIEFLLGLFKKVDYSEKTLLESLRVSSVLNHYKLNSLDSDNIFFTNLFEFADVVRDFYYDLLVLVHKEAQIYKNTTTIQSFFFTNIDEDADVISKFDTIVNIMIDQPDYVQKRLLGIDVLFGRRSPSAGTELYSLQIIGAAVTRIMDYNSIVMIYSQIFENSDHTHHPDYHVFVEGNAHATFVKHLFKAGGFTYDVIEPNNIVRTNDDSRIIEMYSSSNQYFTNTCDITHMFYPKKT